MLHRPSAIPNTAHQRMRARTPIRKHHIDLPALKVLGPVLLAALLGAVVSFTGAIAFIKMRLEYSDPGVYFCTRADPAPLYFIGDDETCESSAHCALTLRAAMDEIVRDEICPGRG